jgi:hypothetical protein
MVVSTYVKDSTDGSYYAVESITTSVIYTLTAGSISASVIPSSTTTSTATSYTF